MTQTYALNENGLSEQEARQLETLIDARGIQGVLQEISEICGLKADHITLNWQDRALAKRWEVMCGAVGVASTKAGGL